jgi:hypothetical protein
MMLHRSIMPKMGASAYKTYALMRPRATHTRVALCAEVDCRAMANGWKTIVDVSTELGRRQANYIRLHSGRSFTATEDGTLVTFVFPAGQKCFAEHRVLLEREPLFRIKDGDFRGNPRGTPVLKLSPIAWRDNFGEHQEKLADKQKEG